MWVPNIAISPMLTGTGRPSGSISLVCPTLHVLQWIPVKVESQLSSCLLNTDPKRAVSHFPDWMEIAALKHAFLLVFTALVRSSHIPNPDDATSSGFFFFSCCMWTSFWLCILLFLAGRKIRPSCFFWCWTYIRPLKSRFAAYNCAVFWGLQMALHSIKYWSMATTEKPYVCLEEHLSGLRFTQR